MLKGIQKFLMCKNIVIQFDLELQIYNIITFQSSILNTTKTMEPEQTQYNLAQYLKLKLMSVNQLKNLENQEKQSIWKSLLKVAMASRFKQPVQAVRQLKLAKAYSQTFYRNTLTQQNKCLYEKTLISILCMQINSDLRIPDYQSAQKIFQQLCNLLNCITNIRQAQTILFQTQSLQSIANYYIGSYIEIKYNNFTQIAFLYLTGVVKLAISKKAQAQEFFQKILEFRRFSTSYENQMTLKTAYWLTTIDPLRYTNYYKELLTSLKKKQNQIQVSNINFQNILMKIINKLLNLQVRYSSSSSASKDIETFAISSKSINNQSLNILLIYISKVLNENKKLPNSQKLISLKKIQQYQNVLKVLKNQQNPYVLRQIKKQQIYQTSITYVSNKIIKLTDIFNQKQLIIQEDSFKSLKLCKNIKQVVAQNNYLKSHEVSSAKASKKSKSVKSMKPKVYTHQMINYIKPTSSHIPNNLQRVEQILKQCKKGSYLIKVNLGNSNIAQRYLKLTGIDLRWAQQKDDIIDDYTAVKIKNVLGITYGKASKNLSKKQNLEPWKCFSIITQERSYDFLCKDLSTLYFWLQGISYHLQIYFNKPISYPYYSKGRALWKMMFLQIRHVYGTKKNDRISSRKQLCKAILTFNERVLKHKSK